MFKVGLENYTVMGKHGAYDFEHEEEQPFVVSIWVELNNSDFADKLENTINYADLQSLVDKVIIDSPPIRLMETMMIKMIESIKQNPLVSKIILPNETHNTHSNGKDVSKNAAIKNPNPRMYIIEKGKMNIFFLSYLIINSKLIIVIMKIILIRE